MVGPFHLTRILISEVATTISPHNLIFSIQSFSFWASSWSSQYKVWSTKLHRPLESAWQSFDVSYMKSTHGVDAFQDLKLQQVSFSWSLQGQLWAVHLLHSSKVRTYFKSLQCHHYYFLIFRGTSLHYLKPDFYPSSSLQPAKCTPFQSQVN